MIRVILIILLTLLAAPAGDAQWAIFQATGSFAGSPPPPSTGFGGGPNLRQVNVGGVPNSVDPSNYYLPGVSAQAISTSDYYHSDGFYWPRGYPLGDGRYFWPMTSDHASGLIWADGSDLKFGFSTDPQVMPDSINNQAFNACGTTITANGNNNVVDYLTGNPFCIYHQASFAIEPNDPAGIYHWYGEGQDVDSSGAGFAFTGTVSSSSPIVTGLSQNVTLALPGTDILVGGDPAQSSVTGTCLTGATTIHTIDSSTQVTLSRNANTNGSCVLTFKNPPIIHVNGVARANNINGPWTMYGPATFNYFDGDWSSYAHPVRLGTNNWMLYTNDFQRVGRRIDGSNTFSGDAWFPSGTATDSNIGLAFQRLDPNTFVKTNTVIPTSGASPYLSTGARRFQMAAWDKITVAGQDWICGWEDARHVVITSANPAVVTKSAHGLNVGDPVYFEMQNPPRLSAMVTAGSANVTGLAGDLTGLQIGQQINWVGRGNSVDLAPVWPQGTTITALNTGAGTLTASSQATTGTGSNDWFFVWSLPLPIMPEVTYYVQSTPTGDTFTIATAPGGAAISTAGNLQNGDIIIPTGGQYPVRIPIDAAFNVLSSPAPVRISGVYSGVFPGPTYIQNVDCMAENGIMTYYVTRGFAASATNFGFSNGQPYNSGNHLPFNNGGALWQELVDIYSEIVDATAAASAAPMGVRVTAAAGAATLTWNDALPTQTYRLYRGTSPTVQTTLVASSITGLTYTDTPFLQTPGIIYYKLVYMNGGTEQGSRVVHTYVSNYSAFTNKHMTRVWDDGVDPATVDLGKIDTITSWLVANNHYNSLERGVGASFGVKQDTSGVVSKAYDIGTTRLPRGNDVSFCATSAGVCTLASTATYAPTTIAGTTPAITVPAGAFGVFGGLLDANGRNGRVNNIRRKWATTVIASYVKSSGSGDTTLLATGEFGGMSLSHLAGTPGTVQFSLTDLSSSGTTGVATIAVPTSALTPHIIAGTFGCAGSGANPCPGTAAGRLFAYVDGTQSSAGSPTVYGNSDLSLATTLRGQQASADTFLLNTGSISSRFTYGTPSQYVMHNNSTAYDIDSIWIFEDEWSAADIATFTALLNSYITPPVAAGSPSVLITSAPYSAACDGSTDDSAAFNAWNTAAVAWDTANLLVPGAIVLTIPNSKCISTATTVWPVRGIVNHPVRVVGAGAASELSDNGTGQGFILGALGQVENNTTYANVATVSKGATSVILTACPGAGCTAAISSFTAGHWARIEGVDLQGAGVPTNPQFWDYFQIICASDLLSCNGGNVSFTTPLTHDYKSTWPNYYVGSGSQPYAGGPATIYALDPTWPVTVEYNNLIISNAGQTYAGGKSITYKNVTFTGTACASPSQSIHYAFINMTMTNCAIEVDKAIDMMFFQNVAIHGIAYQSPTGKMSFFSRLVTNSGGFLNGAGINMILANSTLQDWAPGPTSFGCAYGRTYALGNNITGSIGGAPPQTSTPGVNGVGSWSGGVYTISETDIQTISGGNPALFLAPGCNITFKGTDSPQGPVLQVGDITQSGANTMITFLQNGTTYSGGLPTQPGTTINIVSHPAPQLFASGNYGSAAAIDMNQTPPGAPMGSYSKLIVAGTNGSYAAVPASGSPTVTGNPSTPYTIPVWGKMVGVNITVNPAYGGATSPFNFNLNSPFFEVLGSATRGQWVSPTNLQINAAAGSTTPRFLGPTSTSGPQSGDTLTSPSGGANTWFVTGQMQPVYSTGSPSGGFGSTATTIEITTDQGVVNPAQQ